MTAIDVRNSAQNHQKVNAFLGEEVLEAALHLEAQFPRLFANRLRLLPDGCPKNFPQAFSSLTDDLAAIATRREIIGDKELYPDTTTWFGETISRDEVYALITAGILHQLQKVPDCIRGFNGFIIDALSVIDRALEGRDPEIHRIHQTAGRPSGGRY